VGAGAAEAPWKPRTFSAPSQEGELRAIGATTLDEYRKHIEKDAALERRFQPVYCAAPSVESTIAILRGLKDRYELHHGVRIRDDALVAAATLSDRYITNRFLPDKAIDLVDEAASRLKMEIESQHTELDVIERKLIQPPWRYRLSKGNDASSLERLPGSRKKRRNSGMPGRHAASLGQGKENDRGYTRLKQSVEDLMLEAGDIQVGNRRGIGDKIRRLMETQKRLTSFPPK
jgi:ATP-dependent Clp protease ATP-binding subunit ClpB